MSSGDVKDIESCIVAMRNEALKKEKEKTGKGKKGLLSASSAHTLYFENFFFYPFWFSNYFNKTFINWNYFWRAAKKKEQLNAGKSGGFAGLDDAEIYDDYVDDYDDDFM